MLIVHVAVNLFLLGVGVGVMAVITVSGVGGLRPGVGVGGWFMGVPSGGVTSVGIDGLFADFVEVATKAYASSFAVESSGPTVPSSTAPISKNAHNLCGKAPVPPLHYQKGFYVPYRT